MLKGRDIVVISIQPWYTEIGSFCKNVASVLALQNRVVYINMPINRRTFYSKDPNPGVMEHIRIIREKKDRIQQIGPSFWQYYSPTMTESINWLPSTALFKAINLVNNKRYAKDIQEAVKELGFKDFIIINDNDFFNGYNLKDLLSPHLFVYICRDYIRGTDYFKKHGELETGMIRKADIALANSGYLAEYCRTYNREAYEIGQGCDIELFDYRKQHPVPEVMKSIRPPVIGYTGAIISSRLDESIIASIAKANDKWNVVLVGPEDESFMKSSLHQMPNIHFISRKNIEELPAYIQRFDVCINPQLINSLTIGNYPLKIDEYLALGKPVVATKTKTMEFFSDYTYLAGHPEEYPALIEKALLEDNESARQKRIAFARMHTWENCVEEISRRVEEKERQLISGNTN